MSRDCGVKKRLADNSTSACPYRVVLQMARVAGGLARSGLSCDIIRRFLRYDFKRAGQSRLPGRALRAMKSVASIAVRISVSELQSVSGSDTRMCFCFSVSRQSPSVSHKLRTRTRGRLPKKAKDVGGSPEPRG